MKNKIAVLLIIIITSVIFNSCVNNKYISNATPTNYYLEDKSRLTPFSPTTAISYSVPDSVHVLIVMYNVSGAIVDTVENQMRPPGNYTVEWDAATLLSGIYFYKLTAGEFKVTKKMVFLK